MVSTRPKNKLKKISHRTTIDLSDELAPKQIAQRKITMADDSSSPSKKSVEGSPSPLDETLLKNLADIVGRAPTLDMNVEAGDAEGEGTPAKKEAEQKKEHFFSKMNKDQSTPSSAKKDEGETSRTESSPAQVEVNNESMKEGSSSGANKKQEADSGEGECSYKSDGKDDEEDIAEPPAKKARVQTRAKGKTHLVLVKKEKVKSDFTNQELIMPKYNTRVFYIQLRGVSKSRE